MAALIEPPVPSAFVVSSTSMFFGVFVFFGAAGHLSDVYGRRPIMMAGSLGIALCVRERAGRTARVFGVLGASH